MIGKSCLRQNYDKQSVERPISSKNADQNAGRHGHNLSPSCQTRRRRIGQNLGPAVFDPPFAGSRAAELRRLRSDRSRREKPGRLERGEAGRIGNSLQAGPRGAARFYRRAVRRRSGGHAQRDETARRRSEENQSAGAGRFGDRSLDSGRLFRLDRRARFERRSGVHAATASATNFCAGAKRRSTTSASCRRTSASCTR